MTPWIQSRIPEADIEIFKRIRAAVEALPDLELGDYPNGNKIIMSCHILARATGKVFDLQVKDGFFYPNCNHSWLLLKSNNIVDVYPVSILGGPILVYNENRHWSPGAWLYKNKKASDVSGCSQCRFSEPCFRKAVRSTTKALRKLI